MSTQLVSKKVARRSPGCSGHTSVNHNEDEVLVVVVAVVADVVVVVVAVVAVVEVVVVAGYLSLK
jgi:hypothetical protein